MESIQFYERLKVLVEENQLEKVIIQLKKISTIYNNEVYGIVEKIFPKNGDFIKYETPLFLIREIAELNINNKPLFHSKNRVLIAHFINVVSRNQSIKDYLLTSPIQGILRLNPISEKIAVTAKIIRENEIFFHVEIAANEFIPIGSPISGNIIEFLGKEGEEVRKGTPLIHLEALSPHP